MSGIWWEYVIIGLLTFVIGWAIGALMMHRSYESKYNTKIKGTLRLVYDADNPDHPAMGLMLESMDYLLVNDTVLLAIEKKNFPENA